MNEKISVVIPCYYSEKTIQHVVEQTIEVFDGMGFSLYEFVLVNDGSQDGTYLKILELSEKYSFVKGIDLSKNCGQHNAILAGMRFSDGDYILGMDDDMQTHPSQIQKLFHKISEGYDMIYGKFPVRNHSALRNLGSKINDFTIRFLIGKPKELKACPMYLIKRFVRDEIIKSQSLYTNLQGLFLRSTSKIANVEIEHFNREYGKSGYNFRKLLRLWSSFLNYTVKPIRMIGCLSVLLLIIGFVYLILSLILFIPEINILISTALLLTGIVVGAIGIVGEYIARLFELQTCVPQYVIRTAVNIGEKKYG
jgi:undecaprenyl-phosphate 4-deoxy-4-formamido-L-arabinose transferase